MSQVADILEEEDNKRQRVLQMNSLFLQGDTGSREWL